jgi:hypothetical protein
LDPRKPELKTLEPRKLDLRKLEQRLEETLSKSPMAVDSKKSDSMREQQRLAPTIIQRTMVQG